MSLNVNPAFLRKSSVFLRTAPMLQFPHPLHRPVQASRPESTGCVR